MTEAPQNDVSAWRWVKRNLPTMIAVGGIVTAVVAFGYSQALRLVQIEYRIEQNASIIAGVLVDLLTENVIKVSNEIKSLEQRRTELTVIERNYLTTLYEQRRQLERRIAEVSQ